MLSKIAALGASGILTLAVTFPVFGFDGILSSRTHNFVSVTNRSETVAETGFNTQNNLVSVNRTHSSETEIEGVGNRSISTGNASATSNVLTVANRKSGYDTLSLFKSETNAVKVRNNSSVIASTGSNTQDDVVKVSRVAGIEAEIEGNTSRSINTGSATATNRTASFVNVHVAGF